VDGLQRRGEPLCGVHDRTIFFSAFAGHLPTHALAITAWACLAPIAAAFALIFRLPIRARERQT
jgi:hypothetical protein